MTPKSVQVRILTPRSVVFDAPAAYVVMRCAQGDRAILPGHISAGLVLEFGQMRIFTGAEQPQVFAVLGGMALVEKDVVTVLTEHADAPDKIDETLMQASRERAEKMHRARNEQRRVEMDIKLLRRSLVKKDVSAYSILKGRNDRDL